MEPKVIALYLPQFHRTPENDEWWGEGFTEWTTVRQAESLFEGHQQPNVPLNGNYYNLLEKDTLEWQASLMHKYGIYGMCFYHYYFKDGRKILEKPAENLLQWKDINMPFCFSWANETWARSWSKLQDKNVWSNLEEKSYDKGSKDDGILLLQDYGGEKEWVNHFNYLLPFFKDDRYIKIKGKPIFIIYKSLQIPCLVKMIDCWQKLASDNGFKGIYFISVNSKIDSMDAVMYQEPQHIFQTQGSAKYEKDNQVVQNVFDYKETCLKSITKTKLENEYFCAFPGYDDTPRRGKSGMLYANRSPETFGDTLTQMLAISRNSQREFVFINAWNEWGEGMYLEPDERFGYKYLEAVKNALENYKTITIADSDLQSEIEGYERKLQQYRSYWETFDKWMTLKEQGRKATDFLEKQGVKNIAVYGLGMIGNHFLEEVRKSNLQIVCGIDGKGDSIHMEFPVITINDDIPDVDAIVVTVTYNYGGIYEKLKEKCQGKIYLINELIEESNK